MVLELEASADACHGRAQREAPSEMVYLWKSIAPCLRPLTPVRKRPAPKEEPPLNSISQGFEDTPATFRTAGRCERAMTVALGRLRQVGTTRPRMSLSLFR